MLTLTLRNTAPSVGATSFLGVNSPKNVIVRIPSGATGYGTLPFNNSDTTTNNWGNAIKGKGWDGYSYFGATVNTAINLSIVTY